MTPDEHIVAAALGFIASGSTDFMEVVDHCLETTDLAERAALGDADPAEYSICC